MASTEQQNEILKMSETFANVSSIKKLQKKITRKN
jgi:hypothetical protein